MDAKDLKGRAVVTISGAEKVGEVDDILFDPQYRQVVGFLVKRGLFGSPDALPRGAVNAIGADAITIPSAGVLNARDRFPELADAVTLSAIDGTNVVTAGGDLLGKLSSVEVDDDVRTVTCYTLDASLWQRVRHRVPRIAASDVVRLGSDGIMIVTDAAAAQLRGDQDDQGGQD